MAVGWRFQWRTFGDCSRSAVAEYQGQHNLGKMKAFDQPCKGCMKQAEGDMTVAAEYKDKDNFQMYL